MPFVGSSRALPALSETVCPGRVRTTDGAPWSRSPLQYPRGATARQPGATPLNRRRRMVRTCYVLASA
jgi:hypothetical protein